jgi:mediator of DNA damage checkpoint protein 1
VLGEKGVRGVEADLEGELGEDSVGDKGGDKARDELAMMVTPKRRGGQSSDTPRKNGRGKALDSAWPESSAKDVREVVGVLVGGDDDDVIILDDDGNGMDADRDKEEDVRPKKTPKPKGPKSGKGSARKSGRLSGVRAAESPDPGPSSKRKKKLVFSDEESEDEVKVKGSPVKAAMRPKLVPKPKDIIFTDFRTEEYSDSDDDLPLAPVSPKPKPRAKMPAPLDAESDATSPPVSVPPPTRILKSKVKEVAPPEPSTSAARTPIRKVLSVVMPPLPPYASASKSGVARTESVRATADESIVISNSNPKRNSPGTASESEHQKTSANTRTRSKRSASNKATRKLRDEIMPDVMNFQQEMKKEKGKEKVRAAARSRDDDSISANVGKKRRPDPYVDDDGEDEIDERPSKKKKASTKKKVKDHATSDDESDIVIESSKKNKQAAEDEDSDIDMPSRKTSLKKTSGTTESGYEPFCPRDLQLITLLQLEIKN